MQGVTFALVDQQDEVRHIAAADAAHAVGDFQAKALVLHVGAHLRVILDHAAELGLPVAVTDGPVDVAVAMVRAPADRLRVVNRTWRVEPAGL